MTDTIEFHASTMDEAVEKAALELGLSSEEVSYRVLDEGNSGFLGIGARDARIIVHAPAEPNSETSEEAGIAGSSNLSEVYGESSESEPVVAPEELLDELRVLVTSVLEA